MHVLLPHGPTVRFGVRSRAKYAHNAGRASWRGNVIMFSEFVWLAQTCTNYFHERE